jgi:hypothetical protein
MFVLRELGFCYVSVRNVQRKIAMSPSASASERQAAPADEREWYFKSDAVWNEWKRRGATPESERERLKVEHLLASAGPDRNSLSIAQ